MKFLKVGRVAIITRGRYAGKKVRFYFNLQASKVSRSALRGVRQTRHD